MYGLLRQSETVRIIYFIDRALCRRGLLYDIPFMLSVSCSMLYGENLFLIDPLLCAISTLEIAKFSDIYDLCYILLSLYILQYLAVEKEHNSSLLTHHFLYQ